MPLPASVYSNSTPNVARVHRRSIAESRADAAAEHEIELHRKRKIEQAHRVLEALDARSERLAAQIKRLQKLKAAADARYERIEDRCITEMQYAHLDRAAGIRVTFSLRPAAPALKVDDESLIPAEYVTETITTSVDKVAIKAALGRNVDVPGVRLTQKISLIRK